MIQQFYFWDISKGNKNTNSKRYLHPMFTGALFTVAKTWKQPKRPWMDEWIKKLQYVVYTMDIIIQP